MMVHSGYNALSTATYYLLCCQILQIKSHTFTFNKKIDLFIQINEILAW